MSKSLHSKKVVNLNKAHSRNAKNYSIEKNLKKHILDIFMHKRTLTRAIFARITGTSPLANPMTRMCAPQLRSFKLSWVSFPPTGSYKTSIPFSPLAFKKDLALPITLSLLESITWSAPMDLRYCNFSTPLNSKKRYS